MTQINFKPLNVEPYDPKRWIDLGRKDVSFKEYELANPTKPNWVQK